jgi:hypothetical protein
MSAIVSFADDFQAISPLRRRMIEDMTIRKLAAKTQHDYILRVKDFAVFLGRSPASANDEAFWKPPDPMLSHWSRNPRPLPSRGPGFLFSAGRGLLLPRVDQLAGPAMELLLQIGGLRQRGTAQSLASFTLPRAASLEAAL